jgi:hypothetical protein
MLGHGQPHLALHLALSVLYAMQVRGPLLSVRLLFQIVCSVTRVPGRQSLQRLLVHNAICAMQGRGLP